MGVTLTPILKGNDMAIDKKLIHFGKLADFETQLKAGNILDRSIVFIQDAKKIWTHGTYYDCSEGEATGDEFWYVDDTNGKLTTDYDTEVLGDLQVSRLVTSSIAAYDENEYTTGEQGQVLTADGNGNMHWGDLSIPTKVSELENDKEYLNKTTADESYIKLETFESSTYAKANGLADYYRAYALPTSATGDEDDVLLSRNTVKTINGESIVGTGDIAIQGGSGTITEVKANGTSVATSGVANIPAASTSAYGVTKLSSATNSTSTTLAATASAVKAAYDLANGRQPKLVSGNNIKTINGESILGSGDITISGGGVSEDYVNTAIANAITTTLNTAV